jgi:hypothetical protein
MKFFVPRARRGQGLATREALAKQIHDQLKISMSSRLIQAVEYTHDKKKCRLEVGQLDMQENRYQIAAIFESKPFMVATLSESGRPGPTILVNPDEITKIIDFD